MFKMSVPATDISNRTQRQVHRFQSFICKKDRLQTDVVPNKKLTVGTAAAAVVSLLVCIHFRGPGVNVSSSAVNGDMLQVSSVPNVCCCKRKILLSSPQRTLALDEAVRIQRVRRSSFKGCDHRSPRQP